MSLLNNADNIRFGASQVEAVYRGNDLAWRWAIQATGGDISEEVVDGIVYRFHAFTSVGSHSFDVTSVGGDGTIDVLVVAGGAGGLTANDYPGTGGGGGAGGVVLRQNRAVSVGSTALTVGAGGAERFTNFRTQGFSGGNSTFGELVALGGGGGAGGGGDTQPGGAGGSGGGADRSKDEPARNGGAGQQPGSASGGFGNAGGNVPGSGALGAGSGGGAGGAGAFNTLGGLGVDMSHLFTTGFGDNGWFASGGASPNANHSPRLGGGGTRQVKTKPNTGGGSACRTNSQSGGGPGGSGVVIVRYALRPA